MKNLKKVLSLLLSLGMVFGAAACGGDDTPETPSEKGTLKIASFEGGYGATWTQALADAFMAHNPGITVEVECNPLIRDEAVTAFETGISDYDVYFVDGVNVGSYCENYGSLADISALYSETSKPKAGATEESVLVKDKIRPEIVKEMMYGGDRPDYAGKYYTVPSPSGPCSLVLNIDTLNLVLGAGNWSEPRTTNELIALCDRIVAAEAEKEIAGVKYPVYPLIYSGEALEYWHYLYYPWIAQYGGVSAWDSLNSLKINGEYSQDAYQPEGKLEAYTVLETLIKRSNGYCDDSSMNNKFNASQKYFLQGRACMYITGDWLEREMEGTTSYQAELKMIKTPIISDLATKLGISEAQLAESVSAIDSGLTSVEGVSAEVFNKIKEARAITYTLANSAIGAVHSTSQNVDLAIEFFRFMYTDEGINIVLRESKSYLPVVNASKYQLSGQLSTFRQSVNDITARQLTYIYTSSKDPIRYRAGVEWHLGSESPEVAMGKKSNAVSAYSFLQSEKTLLSQKWDEFLSQVS